MNAPSHITRRSFLQTGSSAAAALGLGAGGLLSGCRGSATSGTASPETLRVFVYAGGHENTMREVFQPRFEQATGTRVELVSGWWDSIAKLKTAPANDPPFDLMITDATQGYPAARDGLFSPIRIENIPSHKELSPAALDSWIFRDRLGLPYPDSVMTLAYRRGAFPEGTTAPATWKDLFRPELKGQIGLYNSFYMSLHTFAAALVDQAGRPGTAHEFLKDHLDDVFTFAREHRGQVKLWWPTSTDMILALNKESVAAGNMHSPEYMQALREKPELAAIVPEHDRAMVQVFWAIPRGTPRQTLAEKALDLLFSREIQSEFAKRGMATARLDVATQMAAEDPLWKSFYPHTEEQLRTLKYYPYDVYSAHWTDITDRWERTILRDG